MHRLEIKRAKSANHYSFTSLILCRAERRLRWAGSAGPLGLVGPGGLSSAQLQQHTIGKWLVGYVARAGGYEEGDGDNEMMV
jgi:hypothetical protein